MRRRQRAGIFLGLPLGIDHQYVPSAAGARLATLRRVGFGRKHIALSGDGLVAALPAALLGFEDEGAFAIEVDPADGVAIVAMMGYDSLEDIIVAFARGARRIGMRQAEQVAKLDQKQAIIRAFLAALLALPVSNKGFGFFGGFIRQRCHQDHRMTYSLKLKRPAILPSPPEERRGWPEQVRP